MNALGIGCLVVVLLLVLGLGALAFRLSRNPIVFMTKEGSLPQIVLSVRSSDSAGFLLEASLSKDVEGFHITDISAPLSCANLLGLGVPDGFRLEGLPLEPEERNDPEAVEFVRSYDLENVRWAAHLPVRFGAPAVFRLPASSPDAGTCTLSISYERRGRLGGMAASTSVVLGSPTGPAGRENIAQG